MCKYMTRNDYNKMRLMEGEPVSSLKVGDYLVWNDGSASEVVKIEYTKSGKTAKVTTTYIDNQAEKVNGKWIAGWKEFIHTFRITTLMTIRRLEQTQEVSPVKQIKEESQAVISSINTESLETQKASLEAVSNQLDKIYNTIQENLNNEEIRQQLRDIENNLKYHYSSLHEMVEDQTMPDANDFNNIETLKTVYITNWKELPEELQNYILSCDKYWIDLQWINLYKDNRIVACIGISGHHKNDIEINSIGAGEFFQWNTTDGYTLNNLEIPADKQQENKIKVTHNEYENIIKELASRIYKNDETKISYSEYEKLLDNYEILPFEINTDNEELKKIINTYADNETIEENRMLYRGSINKSILYNLYENSDYKYLYNEYYQLIICKDDLRTILTYCEGDFIAEVYNSIEGYNKGIERTEQFIEAM